MHFARFGCIALSASLAGAVPAPSLAAPAASVIDTFAGGLDGAQAYDSVSLLNGRLFGTTEFGGNLNTCPGYAIQGCGVVYRLTAPAKPGGAWAKQILYSFYGVGDGGLPLGGVIRDAAGNLFGTTGGGGNGNGIVYELSPPPAGQTAWAETILYTFTGGADGGIPIGGLVADASGNLYGTTSYDGSQTGNCGETGGCGTVFELVNPHAKGQVWAERTLRTFQADIYGAYPLGTLTIDASGNLYGTTQGGGSFAGGCAGIGCGTVFELTPSKAVGHPWPETVLHLFRGQMDGRGPQAGPTFGPDGALYGTAYRGGNTIVCPGNGRHPGCGAVWQLKPPAAGTTSWIFTALHGFRDGPDGGFPVGGVSVSAAGNLYGTTTQGGIATACGGTGCGVTYELVAPKPPKTVWNEVVLHAFAGGADGAYPQGSPAIDDTTGLIYGATFGGDTSTDLGTVFQITP